MDGFLHQTLVTIAALAGVLALAWASLRLLRDRLAGRSPPLRRGPGANASADEALRFVRALPVGPKERVVLLDHRGERWMLGVTAGGINLLARWPLAGEAGDEAVPAPDCGQP